MGENQEGVGMKEVNEKTQNKSLPEKASGGPVKKKDEREIKGYFPGLVDVVLNEDGSTGFLVTETDTLKVLKNWKADGQIYEPPTKKHMPFALPRATAVLKRHETGDTGGEIFEDLLAYLKQFSYLPDNLWVLVACYVFATYIHDHSGIDHMPMLLFWAVPERGKSKTGKAVTLISFRGIHTVDLREANIFRQTRDMKATIFFDLMDFWKKAVRNGAEDILLLRCEKGATVSRVLYPDKGPFKDTANYDIYGPTIIATNEPVHKILETRCLPITMPNKPGYYGSPTPEKAQALKERLTAWRAKTIESPLPEVEPIRSIIGRLWEISKPLVQVCCLVAPDRVTALEAALLEISGQKQEDNKETIEGQIVSILSDFAPHGLAEWEVETSKILERVNATRPQDRKFTSQGLGIKLKALGIKRRKSNGCSVCVIDNKGLSLLKDQYGLSAHTDNSDDSPAVLETDRGQDAALAVENENAALREIRESREACDEEADEEDDGEVYDLTPEYES